MPDALVFGRILPAVGLMLCLSTMYYAWIGSQAFQETPKAHAPAIILGLAPHLAAWAMTQINGSLAAAGTVIPALTPEAKTALVAAMKNEGVLYHGLEVLGGGAILGGLILTAIAVHVIDRSFAKAAAFSLAGGVLTFFGLMHGERIGFAMAPVMAVSYLAVAGVLCAAAKLCNIIPQPAAEPAGHGVPVAGPAS